MEAILTRIAHRSLALLEARDETEPHDDDHASGYLDASTSRGTANHGTAREVTLPTRRTARVLDSISTPRWLCAAPIEERLAALARYILRPPLAEARLSYTPPALVSSTGRAATRSSAPSDGSGFAPARSLARAGPRPK